MTTPANVMLGEELTLSRVRPPGVPARTGPWPKARYNHDAWRQSASCRYVDQELFFPTAAGTAATERAKAVCATCPVRIACLQFALTTNQEFGVWGGCDEDERHDLRREWRSITHT